MRAWQAKFVLVAVLMLALALTACGGGDQYIQVTAGGDHTCGLRSDGSVVCWGSDEYHQLRTPADERFTAISAGGIHTCGLRSDGASVCWGYKTPWGEDAAIVACPWCTAPFPPEDGRFKWIEAGGNVTCGFRTEGDVACWTIRGDGFSPFEAEEIMDVSVGNTHVCGLRTDGTAVCHNFLGVSPPEEERFVTISTAGAHACGLRSDGGALCWGNNEHGQVTSPEDGPYIVEPASPPVDGPFSAIDAGAYHTCALKLDGTAVCWGYDFDTWEDQWVSGVAQRLRDIPISPPPEDERITAIAVGTLHACGLREDGGISCWGSNEHGQASPPGNSERGG